MTENADIIKLPQGVALGIEKGRVVMLFYRPVDRHEWAPHDAAQFGKMLIDHAVAAGAEVVIEVPKRPISKEQRDRMIQRIIHVDRSLQEKGRTPAFRARALVDTLLAMVG